MGNEAVHVNLLKGGGSNYCPAQSGSGVQGFLCLNFSLGSYMVTSHTQGLIQQNRCFGSKEASGYYSGMRLHKASIATRTN